MCVSLHMWTVNSFCHGKAIRQENTETCSWTRMSELDKINELPQHTLHFDLVKPHIPLYVSHIDKLPVEKIGY